MTNAPADDEVTRAHSALVHRLEQFAQLLVEKGQLKNLRPSESRVFNERVDQQLPGIRRILNAIEPGLGDFRYGSFTGSTAAAQAVHRGLGTLRDRAQIEAELRASGLTGAPSLQLHPRVWESARSLWGLGRLPEALEAVWKAVNADMQERIRRRDLSDNKLVQEAFAMERKEQVRLHLPGDPRTETWRSRQLGLLHLAQACVFASRNRMVHTPDIDLDTGEAVEHLAMLSCLCRWTDETMLAGGPTQE